MPFNGVAFRDAIWLTLLGGDPGDLTLPPDPDEGRDWFPHDLLERIAPTLFPGISGSALGALTASSIEGTLDGTFWIYSFSGSGSLYTSLDTRLVAVWRSPTHRFAFERVTGSGAPESEPPASGGTAAPIRMRSIH